MAKDLFLTGCDLRLLCPTCTTCVSPWADDRRSFPRFRLNAQLSEHVRGFSHHALAVDVSETGLALRKPARRRAPHTGVVGLEIVLPGSNEIIWASAEPRFHDVGTEYQASGLHFIAMARKHERLLRDYVRERQARLQRLFAPRPVFSSRFGCLIS